MNVIPITGLQNIMNFFQHWTERWIKLMVRITCCLSKLSRQTGRNHSGWSCFTSDQLRVGTRNTPKPAARHLRAACQAHFWSPWLSPCHSLSRHYSSTSTRDSSTAIIVATKSCANKWQLSLSMRALELTTAASCHTEFTSHILLMTSQCHPAAAEGAKLSTIYIYIYVYIYIYIDISLSLYIYISIHIYI